MRAPYRILCGDFEIRPYRPEDAPEVVATIQGSYAHLEPFLDFVQSVPKDPDGMLDVILTFRGNHDLGNDFVYGIFSRANGRYLGGTGLHPRVGPHAFEIGYWTAVDQVRRGVATHAVAALTRVAFELMGAHRMEIHIEPTNVASRGVPLKLGYTEEGLRRRRLPFGEGILRDTVAYILLRDEHPTTPATRYDVEAFDARGQRLELTGS